MPPLPYGKSDQLKILYPQMSIRLGRFRGMNRLADFADNRQYWGIAFALMRRAESFLMDHVPIAGRIVPGKMYREDQPWYLHGPCVSSGQRPLPPRLHHSGRCRGRCHVDDHSRSPILVVCISASRQRSSPNPTNPGRGIPLSPTFLPRRYHRALGDGHADTIDWCSENGNPRPTSAKQAGSVFVTFAPAALTTTEQVTNKLPNKSCGFLRDG